MTCTINSLFKILIRVAFWCLEGSEYVSFLGWSDIKGLSLFLKREGWLILENTQNLIQVFKETKCHIETKTKIFENSFFTVFLFGGLCTPVSDVSVICFSEDSRWKIFINPKCRPICFIFICLIRLKCFILNGEALSGKWLLLNLWIKYRI